MALFTRCLWKTMIEQRYVIAALLAFKPALFNLKAMDLVACS
jgi:hypothetical protein